MIEPAEVTANEDNIYQYLQAGVDTYKAGSVDQAAIGDAAVGTDELITGAVTTTIILDETITAADLATDSVTAAEIAANAVGSSEIATDAVGAAEIAAGAVGTSELASGVYGTPSVTLSTSSSAGSAATLIRTDATITAFDATAPTTAAFADTPASGSAGVAARRDHKHGMPADPTPNFESGRVSESVSNGSNGTDVSITLDVQSRVVAILTGNIGSTACTGGSGQVGLRRDTTEKEASPAADFPAYSGISLSWSETLAAGTYAFDATLSNCGVGREYDYQLQVFSIPNT